MNRIIAYCLLSVSCSTSTEDYSWFENDWISDPNATMAANSQFQDLDESHLELFNRTFGNLRWSVKQGVLSADHGITGSIPFEISFTIDPIDESRFKFVSEAGNYTIKRTDTGFCNQPEPFGENPVAIECFSPSGT